jgi:hypothetical protein
VAVLIYIPTNSVWGFLFSPHPCQHLLSFVLLMIAILTGVRCNLNVVLICISFVTRDAEHFFRWFFWPFLDFFLWKGKLCSVHLPISSLGYWFNVEAQKTLNNQGNTEQKEQCWSYYNTWPQTVLQSHCNKNSMVLAPKTDMQFGGSENSVMNPCSYVHLIFDKGTQNRWWRKDSLFNKCCGGKVVSACRKLKLDPCLSPCTNIISISKWIKDLNIRPETLKLVQERVRITLELIGIGSNFLNRILMAQ